MEATDPVAIGVAIGVVVAVGVAVAVTVVVMVVVVVGVAVVVGVGVAVAVAVVVMVVVVVGIAVENASEVISVVPEDEEAIALYRAILSAPDDDTVRYAYADRVERIGHDDYAEFVRLQLGPRPVTEREKELWAQYKHRWFGSWFAYTELRPETVRRGFVAELRLPYADWIQYRERLAYRPGWFLRCQSCFGDGYGEYPPVACQYCHGAGHIVHPLPVRDDAPYGKTPRRWPIPVEQIELTTPPSLIQGTRRGMYQLAGSGLPHEEATEDYEAHIVLRLLRRCWPGVAWSVADSADPESPVERERRRID